MSVSFLEEIRPWVSTLSCAIVLTGIAKVSPASETLADTQASPGQDIHSPDANHCSGPMLVGAQYTFVDQHQSALHSPYEGSLSLNPSGDTQTSHTMGAYAGWAPLHYLQLYLDVEKFMGAGVSNATGLAGLTNGDVVREGASGLKKEFYIARSYTRVLLPLSSETVSVERGQDQLPGMEPAHRLEFKVGRMAASDDFDTNRYAGSTRTEFMNWSLWDNPAWDYAANTRGYTDGLMIGYVTPAWSLKYGVYRMPIRANQQELVSSLSEARGENLQLSLMSGSGWILRLLAYRNTANMGNYANALAFAAAHGAVPSITADDKPGRHKTGFAINTEIPLADDGETGLFARAGWNDGRTESFAFTEADRHISTGIQISGAHWHRTDDRFGGAIAVNGLSTPHRDYLDAGGYGFVLGDGTLNYGYEQIVELFYSAQWSVTSAAMHVRMQLSPDFQYVLNPGYNRDRGPVSFWAVRFHLEY